MATAVLSAGRVAVIDKLNGLSIMEQRDVLPTPEAEQVKLESASEAPKATSEGPRPAVTQQATTAKPAIPAPSTRPIPSYPKSRISLVDRFIDEPRVLKVAVIGGGLAGINAGILLPAKVPNIDLTIYEKNEDFVRVSLLSLILRP